jgi:hypothetical protein
MAKLTIAQRRRAKRLGAPPGWNEALEERDNERIKAEAENRMTVFDMAPKRVRARANAEGEHIIEKWWDEESAWF